MKRLVAILSSLFLITDCAAQYTGGNNDGYQLLATPAQNPSPSFYSGGDNDGYNTSVTLNQNTSQNIYTGGNNDGYSKMINPGLNTIPSIYTGGNNDGIDRLIATGQNPQPSFYLGGNNDGYQQLTIFNQNASVNIYTGGNNDGYDRKNLFNQNPLCTGGFTKWNGNANTAWENPANWDCGILPNTNSIVVISSGLVRYPVVSNPVEIKSLMMEPGASIIVSPGIVFKLNGQ